MSDIEPVIHAPTEQRRLEATALVASKVSREESQIVVKKEKLRTLIREGVICLLVIAVAVLAYRNLTEGQRTKAAVIHAAQVNCKQYKDVASIPLAQDQNGKAITSTVGLSLIADFRNSYYNFECDAHSGQLPKPDPWLLPYLDKDAQQGVGNPIERETTVVPGR